MRANFIALDSRMDGGASISWKLLNTRLLWLVVASLGYQSKWYCIPNAIPECSAIKKCSTRAQTSVHWQAHSGNCALAPKKMHAQNAHSTKTFSTVWISFHRSDRLKTDFTTTELAATINVWNTTPFWNGITLIARALVDRRSTVYSWLLSDARTPVWFSRWRLSGQGVVLKRLWMENLAQ